MKNQEQNKQSEAKKVVTLEEAIKEVKAGSKSKFVGSVDIDVLLNLKEKQKKEVIRGSLSLPNSLGGEKKVVVICDDAQVKDAEKAGAVKAGNDAVIEEIAKGWMDFDTLIATASQMPKLVRIGKTLGPKGLMPNPKTGTVVAPADIEKTVNSFKAGRLNYKSIQEQSTVKMRIAKVDMTEAQIQENIVAFLKSLFNESKKLMASPFKKIMLKPTMGKPVLVDVVDLNKYL